MGKNSVSVLCPQCEISITRPLKGSATGGELCEDCRKEWGDAFWSISLKDVLAQSDISEPMIVSHSAPANYTLEDDNRQLQRKLDNALGRIKALETRATALRRKNKLLRSELKEKSVESYEQIIADLSLQNKELHSNYILANFQNALLQSRLETRENHTVAYEKVIESRNPDFSGFVYLVRAESGVYKIGKAINVENRMRTFHVKLPFPVELAHVIECKERSATESYLHKKFADRRLEGEWFRLTSDDIDWIKGIKHDDQLDYERPKRYGLIDTPVKATVR